MKTHAVLLTLTLLVGCGFSEETKPVVQSTQAADAIKLTQAGIGEGLLLTWVDSLPSFSALNSDDILALKKAGVSEKVIESLLKHSSRRNAQVRGSAAGSRGDDLSAPEVSVRYRNEVPVSASTARASGYVGDERDEVEALKDREREVKRVEERVRYSYRDPAKTVVVDAAPSVYYANYYPASYAWPSYYYPAGWNSWGWGYAGYYPSLSLSYYGGWGSRYYSGRYYGHHRGHHGGYYGGHHGGHYGGHYGGHHGGHYGGHHGGHYGGHHGGRR